MGRIHGGDERGKDEKRRMEREGRGESSISLLEAVKQ
jgi:hypothetical protein